MKKLLIAIVALLLGAYLYARFGTFEETGEPKWTVVEAPAGLVARSGPGAPAHDVYLGLFAPPSRRADPYLVTYRKDGTIAALRLDTQIGNTQIMDHRRLPSGRTVFLMRDGPRRFFCSVAVPAVSMPECRMMRFLDPHDVVELPDGSLYLMFYVPRAGTVSTFERTPLDLVIRRFDRDWKLTWEWSSRDHIALEEHVPDPPKAGLAQFRDGAMWSASWLLRLVGVERAVRVPFSGTYILPYRFDYVHGNSMEPAADGGLIVSARDTNTVFKIDVPSGKVAWRLGGIGAGRSDFRVVGDPLGGFARQHSARLLANGHLLLFDNGGLSPVLQSRVVEYALDLNRREATMVWEYRAPEPHRFRSQMGSVQRLGNGNTLIGWGIAPESAAGSGRPEPLATEIESSGRVIWHLESPGGLRSYRAWVTESPGG
jgi:hypothetical protein